jgi:hypothetical protein
MPLKTGHGVTLMLDGDCCVLRVVAWNPSEGGTESDVERFFNRIKRCPRIATQYDKLAANYLAFIKLACNRI